MDPVRVGFAGLASSHPFTDAEVLRRLGPVDLAVWADADASERFMRRHPARAVRTLDELLAGDLDAAVVTVHPDDVAETVARFLDVGVPVFVNKPAAVDRSQLARLASVRRDDVPLMSTSVIRFAPEIVRLRENVAAATDGDLLSVRAVIRHDIGHWLRGDRDWQDRPGGGGLLTTMGIHGVEVLVSLVGPDLVSVTAEVGRRHYRAVQSEDVAVLTMRWASGVLGVVEVLGVADHESYEFTSHHAAGDTTCRLDGSGPDPVHELGYLGTMRAFRRMAATRQPAVPWSETAAVLGALADARAGRR